MKQTIAIGNYTLAVMENKQTNAMLGSVLVTWSCGV